MSRSVLPPRNPARALAYPYDIPDHSYVINCGDVTPIADADALNEICDLQDRVPVLAVGSNQSPSALAWKFAEPEDGAVAVVRAHLKDFDSVYSAHFAGYGSIPATLHTSPGTTVTLFINWLTHDQLARMHQTEVGAGNYAYGELRDVEIKVDCGPEIDHFGLYLGTRGALTVDNAPVPLIETPAQNRAWPAMAQRDLMTHLHKRFSDCASLEDFVYETIDNKDLRESRRATLMETAAVFEHPKFAVVE